MRIEVFGEKKVPDKPTVLTLRLIQRHGAVDVVAVDQYGERVNEGTLLTICSDGTLTRIRHINPQTGLKLDDDGCICLSR